MLFIISERCNSEACDGDAFIFRPSPEIEESSVCFHLTQRNNSPHYGSDVGDEMAVTYNSVIGTVKLNGSSVWNFIGTFLKNIFNGCRDYVNMVFGKIILAISRC